jgi:hypothetical protein
MEVDLKIPDDSECTCSQMPGFDQMLKGMANEAMAGVMGKVEHSGLCTSALMELYANVLLLMVHGVSTNGGTVSPEQTLDNMVRRCRAMFPGFQDKVELVDIVEIRGKRRRDQ